MAEGRRREAWGHTAAIMAQLDNCQAFRSDRPAAKPSDYDPFRAAKKAAAAPAVARKPIDPKASVAAFATALGFEVPK